MFNLIDMINNATYDYYKSELVYNNYKLPIYAHPNELLHEHSIKTYQVFEHLMDEDIVKKYYERAIKLNLLNMTIDDFNYLIKQMVYFHDIGKISFNFQLKRLNRDKNGKLNHVGLNQEEILSNMFGENINNILNIFEHNHSLTSTIIFLESLEKINIKENLLVILIAYCIMGHHTNIKDLKSIDLNKNDANSILKTSYLISFFIKITNFKDSDELIHEMGKNWEKIKDEIKVLLKNTEKNEFCSSFYQYIYSLLITSDVMASKQYNSKEVSLNNNNRIDKVSLENMHKNFYNFNDNLDNNSPINKLRHKMFLESSENLLKALNESKNNKIFYLNMPTGGGKTNTSMKLALDILENTNANRIFYSMPFISILDQNYDIICDNFCLTDNFNIRKLCSTNSFLFKNKKNGFSTESEEYMAEILMNDDFLDYPVICTTFVKLFNTIIRNNKRNKYGFASLSNSVVILDEVQSLPIKNWSSLYYILNDISEKLNIYFIFMSATLPDFNKLDERYTNYNYIPLIKNPQKYYGAIEFKNRTKIMNVPEIFRIDETDSLRKYFFNIIKHSFEDNYSKGLIVLNTIKSSKLIYEIIKDFEEELNFRVDLLNSTILNHKKNDLIKKINDIHTNERYILVSTQSIEAGVDVSFHFVIRDFTTLDSIEQIRGRCNRHGELPDEKYGRIYLIKLIDEKNRGLYSYIYNKEEIETRIKETEKLLFDMKKIDYSYDDLKEYYTNISRTKYELTTTKEKLLESNDNENIKSWDKMLYSNLNKKEGIHIIDDSNQITLFIMTNIDISYFEDVELDYLKEKEKTLDYSLIIDGKVIAKNILRFYDFDQMRDVHDVTHRKILKKEFNSILDKFIINTYVKEELRNEYEINESYKEFNKEYYFFEVIPADLIGDNENKLYSIDTGLNSDYKYFNSFEEKYC